MVLSRYSKSALLLAAVSPTLGCITCPDVGLLNKDVGNGCAYVQNFDEFLANDIGVTYQGGDNCKDKVSWTLINNEQTDYSNVEVMSLPIGVNKLVAKVDGSNQIACDIDVTVIGTGIPTPSCPADVVTTYPDDTCEPRDFRITPLPDVETCTGSIAEPKVYAGEVYFDCENTHNSFLVDGPISETGGKTCADIASSGYAYRWCRDKNLAPSSESPAEHCCICGGGRGFYDIDEDEVRGPVANLKNIRRPFERFYMYNGRRHPQDRRQRFEEFQLRYVYKARGQTGDSCVQSVLYNDDTAPVIDSCDQSIIQDFVADNKCEFDIPLLYSQVTATDNCSKRLYQETTLLDEAGNEVDAEGTGLYTVRNVFTDRSGNSAVCERQMNVVDETEPKIARGRGTPRTNTIIFHAKNQFSSSDGAIFSIHKPKQYYLSKHVSLHGSDNTSCKAVVAAFTCSPKNGGTDKRCPAELEATCYLDPVTHEIGFTVSDAKTGDPINWNKNDYTVQLQTVSEIRRSLTCHMSEGSALVFPLDATYFAEGCNPKVIYPFAEDECSDGFIAPHKMEVKMGASYKEIDMSTATMDGEQFYRMTYKDASNNEFQCYTKIEAIDTRSPDTLCPVDRKYKLDLTSTSTCKTDFQEWIQEDLVKEYQVRSETCRKETRVDIEVKPSAGIADDLADGVVRTFVYKRYDQYDRLMDKCDFKVESKDDAPFVTTSPSEKIVLSADKCDVNFDTFLGKPLKVKATTCNGDDVTLADIKQVKYRRQYQSNIDITNDYEGYIGDAPGFVDIKIGAETVSSLADGVGYKLFQLVDEAAPTLTCPKFNNDIEKTTGSNGKYKVVVKSPDCNYEIPDIVGAASVEDACDATPALFLKGTSFPTPRGNGKRRNRVILYAVDTAGNTATCEYQFEIIAPTPNLICPSNPLRDDGIFVYAADESCKATVDTFTMFWPRPGPPEFLVSVPEGECPLTRRTRRYPMSQDVTMVAASDENTAVTVEAANEWGVYGECEVTVRVEEYVPPVIVECTDEPYVINIDNKCDVQIPNFVQKMIDADLVQDDCTPKAKLSGVQSLAAGKYAYADVAAVENVRVTFYDSFNNANECMRKVEFHSDVKPTVICPNKIPSFVAGEQCGVDTPNFLLQSTIEGSCGFPTRVSVQEPVAGTTLFPGEHTLEITVVDYFGNENSCTKDFKVVDNEPPAMSCGGRLNVEADAGDCVYTLAALTPTTVTDSCDGDVATVQSPAAGTKLFPRDEPYIVSVSAKDSSDNSDYCEYEVYVTDSSPVELQCISSTSSSCEDGVPSFVDTVTVLNPCKNTAEEVSQSPKAGANLGDGKTVDVDVSYYGEVFASCEIDVAGFDPNIPAIECPSPVYIADDSCSASLEDLTQNIVVEQCTTGEVTITQSPLVGDVGKEGLMVTITATNEDNASSSCVAEVVLEDRTPPTIVCDDVEIVQLDNTCTTPVAVSMGYIESASDQCDAHDDLLIEQYLLAGGKTDLGPWESTDVYSRATDKSGNYAVCSTTVKAVPPSLVVECNTDKNSTPIKVEGERNALGECVAKSGFDASPYVNMKYGCPQSVVQVPNAASFAVNNQLYSYTITQQDPSDSKNESEEVCFIPVEVECPPMEIPGEEVARCANYYKKKTKCAAFGCEVVGKYCRPIGLTEVKEVECSLLSKKVCKKDKVLKQFCKYKSRKCRDKN